MRKKLVYLICLLSVATLSYSKKDTNVYCAEKIAKVEYMIKDVVKTEHQVVPKYVSYIDISNIEAKDFEVAKRSLSLLINANSLTNDNLTVFVNENEKAKSKIIDLLISIGINKKNIYEYSNKREMLKKILKIRNGRNDLLSNRIAVFSKSSNIRQEYAKIINVLDEYVNILVVDNYSYLDIPRSDLLNISDKEKEKILNEIKCNYKK